MSGFFDRLAQRTLGTAQAIRPSIAPRFAQTSITTNEFSSADAGEDLAQQSGEISNNNEKPQWQKPVIAQAPKTNLDNPHLHEQPGQTESQQAVHLIDPHSERYDIQPDRKERDFNIVKAEIGETNKPIDRVNSAENINNDTQTPTIPALTENQIISKDQANLSIQTDFKHDQFVASESSATGESWVPIPHQVPSNKEDYDTPFKDGDPINVHQVSGKESRQNVDKRKQQSPNEAQTINVTIGRVEVRAVQPTPAPIKRERAKTKPALSLDEYLQQRQKGER